MPGEGKKKKIINHFLQVFGVSYAPKSEKCFGNRQYDFSEHSCAPILTKKTKWWGRGF